MQPDTIEALRRGDLAGRRELRLSADLTEFPREIFGLAETLEVLDLGGNALASLPDDMGRLSNLRMLFCSGNRFERLPPALGDCGALSQVGFRGTGLREVPAEALPASLRWLTLTDNRIEHLPAALGERPLLQKLMLSGNRLRALPETLRHAERLELIRLSSNRLEALPAWLADLPSLAWLSWSGNPAERALDVPTASTVRWEDVALGDRLGEGASGHVHRAIWRPNGGDPRDMALKLFKGAMTSDGLPEREMAACLVAGAHPSLAGGVGRLIGHPDARHGLLMPLLPGHWRGLAGPPSPASCSRDVYDPNLRLRPEAALRIALRAAEAAAHLHARGLMHGDLYAHNILWDGDAGEAVLTDFGAASVLPEGREGQRMERIEVRAWGLLLAELLSQCAADPPDLPRLQALASDCVQPDAGARPRMAGVVETLRDAGCPW